MLKNKNKIYGVLGLWVVALAFLGFSESMHRFLLIITGLFMVVDSFWGKYLYKSTKEIMEESSELEKELKEEEEGNNRDAFGEDSEDEEKELSS